MIRYDLSECGRGRPRSQGTGRAKKERRTGQRRKGGPKEKEDAGERAGAVDRGQWIEGKDRGYGSLGPRPPPAAFGKGRTKDDPLRSFGKRPGAAAVPGSRSCDPWNLTVPIDAARAVV